MPTVQYNLLCTVKQTIWGSTRPQVYSLYRVGGGGEQSDVQDVLPHTGARPRCRVYLNHQPFSRRTCFAGRR